MPRRASSAINRLTVLTAALAALAGSALAVPQTDPAGLKVRRTGPVGVATFLTPAQGGFIPVAVPRNRSRLTSWAFWDQYGSLFGITDPAAQLTLDAADVDALGLVHTTFQQYHQGVQVFSGVLKLHQSANGNVLAANGRAYPIKPSLSVKPSLDEGAAIAATRRSVLEKVNPIVEDSQLVIVDPGWYGDQSTGARLAWFITLTDLQAGGGGGYREAFFIDAHTGEVIDSWSLIEQLLSREAYDGLQTGAIPGTLARAEGDPAASDADVNRAYDFAGDFYNYFQRGFARDSIDNNGFVLKLTANSRSTGCPNAYWNGMQSVYCTGVVTDDIVAHELAHGLIGNTARLIYQNQSGQLNESFADVFGELVDLFNGDACDPGTPGSGPPPYWPNPSPSGPGTDAPNNLRVACSPRPFHPDGVRWCIGEDSAAFSGAIREMYDPTCRGDPDKASSPFMTCQANDSGGVHHGSGVPNKGFALLVDGGTFNGRTIVGIGTIKSGAIWYRALTTYLTPASDFRDAYDAFIQSANDLLGTFPADPRTGLASASAISASDITQLTLALQAVELDTDGACGQAYNVLDESPPIEAVAPQVLFSENFESGAPGWTVANSAPPTPYDWTLTTTPLPWSRPGIAYFCEDRAVGDCLMVFESAIHSLTSPTIAVPSGTSKVILGFTHHLASEGRFDGGRVEISVAGGAWTPIPRTAFEFNPYNSRLVAAAFGNSNPIAGADVFSGAGGRWGRSLVDLSSFSPAGNNIQLRWVFAKDGCGGGGGWYLDDLAVYLAPDCDANAVADIDQFVFRRSSSTQLDVGWMNPKTVTLTTPPQSAGAVALGFLAVGDFSAADEYLDITLNGVDVGRVFHVAGADCGGTPMRAAISVPATVWNPAAITGSIVITMTAPNNVTTFDCIGSWVAVSVQYALAAPDFDADGILDACDCPVIAQQPAPAAQQTTVGGNATVTAAAVGQATLTYQWRLATMNLADGPSAGGGIISGATTPAITITGAGFLDAGLYDLVVTNPCGSTTTSTASLGINPACPSITTQPQPIAIDSATTGVFTVVSSGTAPLTYQWRRNTIDLVDGPSIGGGTISGALTDTLTISSAGYFDSADYGCFVTNACGNTTSNQAALTVAPICPVVTQSPQPLSVGPGGNASFTALALGQATLGYQWRVGGIDLANGPSAGGGVISGATTTTLTITGAGLADGASYDCVVTNTCGQSTTTAALLTIDTACPVITTQPQPQMVEVGDDPVFTIAGNGTAPFTYVWKRGATTLADGPSAGGGVVSGATTAALTITNVGLADAGDYRTIVTNACGTQTSSLAALTVEVGCPADFNQSGEITVQDIFDFLAAYFAGDPDTDINNSGEITVQDIFDFLAAYFAGCP